MAAHRAQQLVVFVLVLCCCCVNGQDPTVTVLATEAGQQQQIPAPVQVVEQPSSSPNAATASVPADVQLQTEGQLSPSPSPVTPSSQDDLQRSVTIEMAEQPTPIASTVAVPANRLARKPRLFAQTTPIVRTEVPAAQAAAAAAAGTAVPQLAPRGMALARHLYAATPLPQPATVQGAAACNASQCATDLFGEVNCNARPVGNCGNGISYFDTTNIVKAPQAVPIFYGNWTAAQRKIIQNFLWGLTGSDWWNVIKSYSDLAGYVNTATSRLYDGTTAVISNAKQGTKLNEMQIQNIVRAGITTLSGANNGQDNVIYIVLAGNDVTADGFCNLACGWHSYFQQPNGVFVKYMYVGNAITQCAAACIPRQLNQGNAPNGDLGVDGLISTLGHELAETVTDPTLNQWFDSKANEVGDKCSWDFGTTSVTNGKLSNTKDKLGRTYLLQQLWNPVKGACVLK